MFGFTTGFGRRSLPEAAFTRVTFNFLNASWSPDAVPGVAGLKLTIIMAAPAAHRMTAKGLRKLEFLFMGSLTLRQNFWDGGILFAREERNRPIFLNFDLRVV
jgi:hypothetical protein